MTTVKFELMRQCYHRGYTREQVTALIQFIDWLIRVPDVLNNRIAEKISKFEEDNKMPYITSFERLAEARGVKIGEERGMIKTARVMLTEGLDMEAISRYTGLSLEEIKKLAESNKNN